MRSAFGPVDGAAETLAALVTLADEGLCEPIPLATKASHAYAKSRLSGRDQATAEAKARAEWTRFEGTGEADDDAHRLVWGPDSTLDRLLAAAATGAEPTRFGALALRLWEPLCRAETTDQL